MYINVGVMRSLLLLITAEYVIGYQGLALPDLRLNVPFEELPPSLTVDSSIREVYGEKGDMIKLKCPAEGPGDTMYRWWKDGDEVDSFWSWFRLSPESHRTLRIKRLNEETVGRYRCRGINGYGKIEFRFIVSFHGDNSFRDSPDLRGGLGLLINHGIQNITVEEGYPIRLSCTLKHDQKLNMRWIKRRREYNPKEILDIVEVLQEDNVQIIDSSADNRYAVTDGYQIENDLYLYRLSVLAAHTEDSGSYLCVVFVPRSSSLEDAYDYQVATVQVLSSRRTGDPAQTKYRSEMLSVLAVLLPLVFVLLVITVVLVWKTKFISKQCPCGSTGGKQRSEGVQGITIQESKIFLRGVVDSA